MQGNRQNGKRRGGGRGSGDSSEQNVNTGSAPKSARCQTATCSYLKKGNIEKKKVVATKHKKGFLLRILQAHLDR